MSEPGSVTFWISQLKAGGPAAAQPLWRDYFGQLVAGARSCSAGTPGRADDEQAVAAQLGRVPRTIQRRPRLIRKIREQELPA
jgi:hypothetical protein